VVHPKASIPPDLLSHLRYPEDQFKVQRDILAQYHVTAPQTFYRGTDRWEVPEDPSDQANKQPPYRLSVQLPPDGSASGKPGTQPPVFSITSLYVPTNKANLASYISANSDANSPDYGQIRVLRLPDETQVQGPSQIANTFAADEKIQAKLLPIKQNSQVIYGNLLTLPVGGGLLYVQPVYALRESGQGAYPVLQFVLASFGKNAGYGNSLTAALNDVLKSGSISGAGGTGGTGGATGGKGNHTGKGAVPSDVLDLLQQADDKYTAAEQALKQGDFPRYAKLQTQAESLVRQALDAAQNSGSGR
jgi:uncharacterized membrane protein (UPF0182 family)